MTIVEFLDPIVNKTISYSISTPLAEKWEHLSEKVIEENSDRVYVVTGKERSGKTFWVCQEAKFIDPTFNIDRICFTPEQFLEQIRNATAGSVVVFDEAFRGFSTRATLTKINRLLVQSMMEVGRRNLIIFIVLPVFSLLDYYVAINRSYALFVIYKTKPTKGKKSYYGWRGYSEKKKSMIYYKSKKSWGVIPYVPSKLRGKFFAKQKIINKKEIKIPYETFPIEEYEKKKDEAFKGKKEFERVEEESKMTKQRRILLVNFYLFCKKYLNMTGQEFVELIGRKGIKSSRPNLMELKKKVETEGDVIKIVSKKE